MEPDWIIRARRWGYVRIITGTIVGGIIGFYFMHRAELKYKEMWNRRLAEYVEEKKRRENLEFGLSADLQEKFEFGESSDLQDTN